jgi:hypothetical protein
MLWERDHRYKRHVITANVTTKGVRKHVVEGLRNHVGCTIAGVYIRAYTRLIIDLLSSGVMLLEEGYKLDDIGALRHVKSTAGYARRRGTYIGIELVSGPVRSNNERAGAAECLRMLFVHIGLRLGVVMLGCRAKRRWGMKRRALRPL